MPITNYSHDQLIELDRRHIWHPYSSIENDNPLFAVVSAEGAYIQLQTGERLIDGMSSWWSTLHGYNHPQLNRAVEDQLKKMAHVMFGGFTHEPAVKLAKQLVDISPAKLKRVFFSDSGSVAVEVAMKMAIQFWQSQGQNRQKFLTIEKGYHGDTFAAMSVCDPVTGMHHMYTGVLMEQLFTPQPRCRFYDAWSDEDFNSFESKFLAHQADIAAVILEPIVQGTGGMHFYSPTFLKKVRALTSAFGVPLIADEIATGMGRTGRMFACEHADVEPDIMCLGKTLSAGYITLAATLCSDDIATTICDGKAGVFMHGPTFMANPLACSVASKSIALLFENDWQLQVKHIENWLNSGLAPCKQLKGVADVRVLGSIGVVEMDSPVDLKLLQPEFVKRGIWLRPFGKLIYMIPPYIINKDEIDKLCAGVYEVIDRTYGHA